MCGILGYTLTGKIDADLAAKFEKLFVLTQSRGAHASGIAWGRDGEVRWDKEAKPAAKYVRGDGYARVKRQRPSIAIAHTRWATNGHPSNNANNHPHLSRSGKLALVHNGMIFNWEALKLSENLPYNSECDSEVIMRMTEKTLGKGKSRADIRKAIRKAAAKIMGSASFAIMSAPNKTVFLVCHRNPVHLLRIEGVGVIFASEASALFSVFGKDADVRVMSEDTIITAHGDSYEIHSIKFSEYSVPTAQASLYRGAANLSETTEQINADGTEWKGWYDGDESRWDGMMSRQSDDTPPTRYTYDSNGQLILDSERFN